MTVKEFISEVEKLVGEYKAIHGIETVTHEDYLNGKNFEELTDEERVALNLMVIGKNEEVWKGKEVALYVSVDMIKEIGFEEIALKEVQAMYYQDMGIQHAMYLVGQEQPGHVTKEDIEKAVLPIEEYTVLQNAIFIKF